MDPGHFMTRAALGQIASLGSIYDGRSDKFIGSNIFKGSIPKSKITSTDNKFFDVKFITSDTLSEKFSRLNVSAELQVSVLGGLFSVEGSGKYINDEKKTLQSVEMSLLCNILTKDENVNIFDEKLKDYFSEKALNSGTHIVVGISWGSNSLVSCTYKLMENENRQEIEGILGAKMQKATCSIKGKGAVEFQEGEKEMDKKLEIRIFGDVLPDEIPQNYESAIELIKNYQQLVKSSNEGKGKPITYTLYPIKDIAEYLNHKDETIKLVNNINQACLYKIVNIFEDISKIKQIMNDQLEEMKKYEYCISPTEHEKVRKLKESFYIAEAQFRSKLSVTLVKVRGGKANTSELDSIISEYYQNESSSGKVQSNLRENFQEISEKISFAKILSKCQISYIGYDYYSSLEAILAEKFDLEIYLFYFKLSDKRNDKKWELNRDLFFNEIFGKKTDELGPKPEFVVVDCDANPSLCQNVGNNIQIRKNGKITCSNLLEKRLKFQKSSIAKCTKDFEKVIYPPNKRSYLEIECPSIECVPRCALKWLCEKCEKYFEFGYDNYIYCSCGRGEMYNFEFKCSSSKHGNQFEVFKNKSYFEELISKITPFFKEMNILILGQTGVGKSTWINGFANYLTYESLEDAEKNDLLALIHTKFVVLDNNYKEIKIETGINENEFSQIGHSSTKKTKIHTFQKGDLQIRLIDTPGVGDVRGLLHDQINFQNILRILGYLKNLHGICILLKPNESILNVMFRFCINELLTHLHKDASRNIVFCFTNTRGTSYKPQDTLPALNKLLSENTEVEISVSQHTVYCFDSEALRYLAVLKADIKSLTFNDKDRENFKDSWEKSKSETERLLVHLNELSPHPISSTLRLNTARTSLLKLTQPLAEITVNILRNIELIKHQEWDFEKNKQSAKDFEKEMYIDKLDNEIKLLDYPKTVCSESSCTESIVIGGLTKTYYKTICHDHCYVDGILEGNINNPDLMFCFAMDTESEECTICSHSYRVHTHIWYDTDEVYHKVVDEDIQRIIGQKLSSAEKIRKFIDLLRNTRIEYEEELENIKVTCAKIGWFLKSNAITAYNDALVGYLDMLISKEEKMKSDDPSNTNIIEGLKKMRTGYKVLFERFEIEYKQGTGSESTKNLSEADINEMLDKLYEMKHFGKNIQNAMNISQAASYSDSKNEFHINEKNTVCIF